MILVEDLLQACMYSYHTLEIISKDKKGIETTAKFKFSENCPIKYLKKIVTDFNCRDGRLILFVKD